MAAYQTVTLTGTYQTPDGTPHKGHVEIIPSERVIKDTTGDVILTGRVKVDLDAQGAFTVALPATDDPTLNPTGFGYTIAAKLHSSHPPAVSFSLPASLGATTVEDVTPVDPSTFTPNATYADASTVTALDSRVTTVETTKADSADLATVATSGNYGDLAGQPTIPTTAADVGALPDTTVIPSTAADLGAEPAGLSQGTKDTLAEKRLFEPGASGGTRRWVLLATLDGINGTTGAYANFIVTGTGDYGGSRRGTIIVQAAQRGDNNINIDAWGFGVAETSDPIELHTTQISTYKFEIWAKVADWNQTHALHVWASRNATINPGAGTTTAPANPVRWPIDAIVASDTTASRGATLYGYGHSYMAGTGATSTDKQFIQRLGVAIGAGSVVNRGVSGIEMWKLLRYLIPQSAGQSWTPGTKGLVVLDCVLNDVLHTTEANVAQDLIGFTNAFRTALRVLRSGSYVPCTDASITYGGTWTNQTGLNGSRTGTTKLNSTANDTATITNYTPTEITVMAMGFAPGAQTKFEVSVGGTVYGGQHDTAGIATTNGYQIHAYRVTGLPAGAKSVVVTNKGGGGNNLYLDGYLTPSTAPPSIVAVRDAQLPAYNTSPFSKTRGDELLDAFNGALSSVVREPEFKYPFQTVDVDAGVFYDPATMVDLVNTNGLHRNDAGHEALSQALLTTVRQLPYRSGVR